MTNLENVTIPESVNIINIDAFVYGIRLESIKIPNNVSIISYFCFDNCINFKNFD